MFIPIWALVLAGGGLFIGGFLIAAVMSAGSNADDGSEADEYLALARQQSQLRAETDDAHTRCADALGTTQRKLAKIRELTGGKETLRKGDVRAVLDGDV